MVEVVLLAILGPLGERAQTAGLGFLGVLDFRIRVRGAVLVRYVDRYATCGGLILGKISH
jgi:hypothetical protein